MDRMLSSLANQTVMPMSMLVVLMFATLLIWGRWAALVDDDARYYYLGHRLWNGVTVGAGALGFLLWLVIPIFFVGMLICWLCMAGAVAAYCTVRNKKVEPGLRWTLSNNTFINAIRQKRQDKNLKVATLKFIVLGKIGKEIKPLPAPTDPRYAAHMAIEELLLKLLGHKGQRLEIAGDSSTFKIRLNVDGVEYPAPNMSPKEALAMIDYLKSQCGMDVEDRRKKATGQCTIETLELGIHDLIIHTSGSTKTLELSALVDPAKNLDYELNKIGLLDNQLAQLAPVLADPSGLVLIASPARHGRSATLYSVTRTHDPYMLNVHIVESRIELPLEGVHQTVVEQEALAKTIRTLMLQEPNVMMVANVDEAAAKTIVESDLKQTRVYAGLRADDTFKALMIWLRAVGDPGKAVRQLRAVVAQRLVRRLCETCSQAYKPDADALKKLNLPADRITQLFKSSGKVMVKNQPETCPTCNGLGYRGRLGAFEVMVLDDEARSLIIKDQGEQLRSHLRRNKMMLLQEAALAKAVAGQTSISEVMRALGKDK